MRKKMATLKKALNYVHNTKGNADYWDFVEAWKPVGHMLFNNIDNPGYIKQDEDGNIYLTEKGKKKREELNNDN